MRYKNVLLVYPEFPPSFWGFQETMAIIGRRAAMPPLPLLTVAGMMPVECNFRLVDMNVRDLTGGDIQWADIVMISSMVAQQVSLRNVIRRCRTAKPGMPIVAGGPYPTSYYDAIDGVDYFVLGEVEETLGDFLADLEKGS